MVATARIQQPKGKSKPLPDLSGGGSEAHNGPDREEFLFMIGQIGKANDVIKVARKQLKTMRSQAKLRGFELEQMDRAIEERERDDNTTVEGLKVFKRYCEFLNLPIGSQITLFDTPKSNSVSQESILKRAHDAGYERGVKGDFPDNQAYPPATPEGVAHGEGWTAGQKVNAEKFIKLNEDIQSADKARAERAAKKAAKNGDGDDDAGDEGEGESDADETEQPTTAH